jgi:hypothetical protein
VGAVGEEEVAMTLSQIAARVLSMQNIVTAGLVVGGLLVASWGVLKVPSQQIAIQQSLDAHTKQTETTNRKLDVLICLQAKLDTPIRCVAREAKSN